MCFIWVEAGQWGAQITPWSDPRFTSLSALWATSSPRLELALNLVSGLSGCSTTLPNQRLTVVHGERLLSWEESPSQCLLPGSLMAAPAPALATNSHHYTPMPRLGLLPFIGHCDLGPAAVGLCSLSWLGRALSPACGHSSPSSLLSGWPPLPLQGNKRVQGAAAALLALPTPRSRLGGQGV